MRQLFLFLTFFVSLNQGHACPNLVGEYGDCRDTIFVSSPIMDFSVQRNGNKTTLSQLSGAAEIFVTDGRIRTTTIWSEGVRVRRDESAVCESGTLMSTIFKRELDLKTVTKISSTTELPLVIERIQNQSVVSRIECTIKQD